MTKGQITITTIGIGASIFFGIMGLSKWILIDPLREKDIVIEAKAENALTKVASVETTLGRLDEKISWIAQSLGYKEKR